MEELTLRALDMLRNGRPLLPGGCHSDGAVQTDQSIGKVVASTYRTTKEAFVVRSCISNQRNLYISFSSLRVNTPDRKSVV